MYILKGEDRVAYSVHSPLGPVHGLDKERPLGKDNKPVETATTTAAPGVYTPALDSRLKVDEIDVRSSGIKYKFRITRRKGSSNLKWPSGRRWATAS